MLRYSQAGMWPMICLHLEAIWGGYGGICNGSLSTGRKGIVMGGDTRGTRPHTEEPPCC
jgi:hypothetical protein